MESYDVIIVGAGPAGLKCAEVLAKNNKKVLVLEKNKIFGDKVCAGGLTIKDLELGIPDKVIERKFDKFTIHTPLQNTDLTYNKSFIATISRRDLGKWMANNAKKQGAKIRLNSSVTKISDKKIIVNNKDEIYYEYLVGADGSNSLVRKFLGLKTEKFLQAYQYIITKKFNDIEIFVDPESFGHGYVWIFPHKDFTSIGTGVDYIEEKNKALGLKSSDIKKNFDSWCKKRFDVKKAKFQAFIINYDYQGHEFGNKFLIGDAAGFASGLTGEGIYNSIRSGEDVTNKIINSKYKCKNIEHILKVKRIEERFLRSSEINKTLTKIEWEICNLLLKIKTLNYGAIESV